MQGALRQDRQSANHLRRTRAQQVQSRRFTLVVCLLALSVVVTAVGSYSARAEASSDAATPAPADSTGTPVDPTANLVSATYTAELRGDYNNVGSGRALLTLDYDADLETLSYVLEITSPLGSPSVAAICQGSPGQAGTTVFTIFAGPTVAGDFSGTLSQGEVAASDLVGPLQGSRLADLALMLSRGEAYATIGTASVPVDAVRGQIR